jgi:hypothetical protein
MSSPPTPAQQARQDWSDSFGDASANFLRLTDPVDQAAFRRWLALIAGDQSFRPGTQVPAEIADRASMLRCSCGEALRRSRELFFFPRRVE